MTAPAASRAATPDARSAFEAWVLASDGKPAISRDEDGSYQWFDTRQAWWAWQAAFEAAQPASPAPLTKAAIDEIVYACRQSGQDTTYDIVNAAIAALASPQVAPAPKPVAWMMKWPNHSPSFTTDKSDYVSWFAGKASYPEDLVPLYLAAPVQVAPAPVDGYAEAFYEIASVLGIGARSDTPENVFRNEMLPRIKALASQPAAQPTAITADEINGKPPTAQSILESMVDIQEDYERNAPEHRCYADSAQREIFEMARRFVAAPIPTPAAADDAREAECHSCLGSGDANYLAPEWPEEAIRCEKCGGTGKAAAKPAEPTQGEQSYAD